MDHCHKCGRKVHHTHKHCHNCGAKLMIGKAGGKTRNIWRGAEKGNIGSRVGVGLNIKIGGPSKRNVLRL